MLHDFDVGELDVAIQMHLWKNSDDTKDDILFLKFFPNYDTFPEVVNLPLVTITAPRYPCIGLNLPDYSTCYDPYQVARDPQNFVYYNYHCTGNGVWVKGDSVKYERRHMDGDMDSDKEYTWGDGGANFNIIGYNTGPFGELIPVIEYVPSYLAYSFAIGRWKNVSNGFLMNMLHAGLVGLGTADYPEHVEDLEKALNYFYTGNGAPLRWDCEDPVSIDIKELDQVQEDFTKIEQFLRDWVSSHDNLDGCFVDPNIGELENSLGSGGPNLSYFTTDPPFTTGVPTWVGGLLGGTQGRTVQIIKAVNPGDCWDIDYLYTIWDNFGVGLSDAKASRYIFPGLVAFWVLQHYRSDGTTFVPVKNHSVEIVKNVTICN